MGQSYRYGLQRNPKPVLGEVDVDESTPSSEPIRKAVCVLLEACIVHTVEQCMYVLSKLPGLSQTDG
jgi:hypothetical protein